MSVKSYLALRLNSEIKIEMVKTKMRVDSKVHKLEKINSPKMSLCQWCKGISDY